MEDYKPLFTITNEILSRVSSISEKIGHITATSVFLWHRLQGSFRS